MLRIGPDFVELVNDDVPIDEEMRMRDSNIELEEEDADDPYLGVEALGPYTDNDTEDA